MIRHNVSRKQDPDTTLTTTEAYKQFAKKSSVISPWIFITPLTAVFKERHTDVHITIAYILFPGLRVGVGGGGLMNNSFSEDFA